MNSFQNYIEKVLALLSIIHNPEPSPLIIIEEFENGLDPWTISYLIKKLKELTGSQVIITTHSPTLLNLIENYDEILFAKRDNEKGTLEYVRFDEEKKMFDDVQENILPGELYEKIKMEDEKNIELQEKVNTLSEQIAHRDRVKCLVFTEDEKQEDTINGKKYLIEVILEASGIKMDEVKIISFNSKDNITSAIISSSIFISSNYPNLKKIIFHIDRDVNNEEKKKELEEKIDKRISNKGRLFFTKGYDVESYFINRDHIKKVFPTIDTAKIQELINEAIDEADIESQKKMMNALFDMKEAEIIARERKKSKHEIDRDEPYNELLELYKNNKERYLYGKSVLRKVCDKIRRETKLNAKIEILQSSEFIKDEELEKIAKEIWG